MPKILLIVLTTIGSIASAYPGVGDYVLYEGCVVRAAKCIPFSREQLILTIANPTNVATLYHLYQEEGVELNARMLTLHKSGFRTPKAFRELLAKCQGEDAQTKYEITDLRVPAGIFKTCKQTNIYDGTETYIADVPFGFVKVVAKELQYELISFRNGFSAP